MFEKIGSLYINGAPAKTGAMYQPGDIIGLGDTAPGLELYWKPIDKHSYILAAPALLCISWRQLRDLGFVSGKPFQMDGRMFMVHLPRLGVKPPINRSVPEGISFWGRRPSSVLRERNRNSAPLSPGSMPTAGTAHIRQHGGRIWDLSQSWTRVFKFAILGCTDENRA